MNIKSIIVAFINNIVKSFDNKDGGFSGRKLTAFVVTCLIVYIHIKWVNSCYKNNHFSLLPEILIIDFSAVFALLGLTTWERVIGKKDDKDKNS